ncbi:MAG: methyltransferase domain-containing protein [Candidatus Harrisonbacteria bacterium]|nr:methyltransferase domain-containing protein [Candidatus Harrisonbacteria bacterium]
MNKKNTSWGGVADWYENLLGGEGIYQKNVILPNLLRLLDIKKGEVILDLACGQGFFAKEFSKKGAKVIGADIAKELIDLANKGISGKDKAGLQFRVAPADDLDFLSGKSADKITLVLAIQNMENVNGVFKECARVLKSGGKIFLVMNHPAFRNPKESSWGWDAENKIQFRRIDSYLSESKVKIQMHPGEQANEYTLSFHRPLQFYFKALNKNNFSVCRLEEWVSNKKSEPGPRAAAENRARSEFPLFLFLEAQVSNEFKMVL